MYIESIKIGNFGKLSSKEIKLTSGVNIIEGNNESGKTTLSEFIKFVFYGLSNKSSDGEMSERKRHISWSTNDVSGSAVLNTENGSYRIERSMTPYGTGYRDSITVVDLSTNSILNGIKNPGEYFFGIPEEVFTKTVYIRQADGAYFNGESIGQSVENIFYSADESVNTEKALKKLDEARIMIKHKKNTGRGLLDQLEREREELSEKLSQARSVNEQILQCESSLKIALMSITKNKNECERLSKKLRLAELLQIAQKFDERKKYKENIDKLNFGKEEIIKATTVNGFFPDERYYSEMEKMKTELSYLKKDVDKYDEITDINFTQTYDYSKETADKIRQRGGKGVIKDFLKKCKSDKEKALFSLIISVISAFICAALGIFTSKICFVGTALFGAICIVFGVVYSKSNAKIRDIFDDFSAEDEMSLFDIISKTEEYEKYDIRNRELGEFKEQKKKNALHELDECIGSCLMLLGKWGVTPSQKDYDGVMNCIQTVISDIAEITNSLGVYDKETEKNRAVLKLMDSQLDGYDETTIREEISSIDESVDPDTVDEIKKRFDFCTKAKDSLNEKVNELGKKLAELKAKTDRPSDIESKLNMVSDRIKELTQKYEAYVLAYEKLQEAGYSLRGKLAPGLSEGAGKYMSVLTNGKYSSIGIQDDLKMTYSFEENGTDHTKEIDTLSSGTRDAAYVSLRLALAELFCRSGEKLPVVFDEAFARLDDDRLKNMLLIVEKYAQDNSQAIILTSHFRENELMREINNTNEFNYIRV